MSEQKHTPGPWRWQRAENGEGEEALTLVGSPDDWRRCEYFCFGWKDGSPRSRGPLSTPGHEHNRAPTVLSAMGWHGSGDLTIEPDSADAHLIAAAPDLLAALKRATRYGVKHFCTCAVNADCHNDPSCLWVQIESAITKAEPS